MTNWKLIGKTFSTVPIGVALYLWVACVFISSAQSQTALQYVKKVTWRETWEASLDASLRADVVMGDWYYIGPFDSTNRKGFDTVYPAEKEIRLDAAYTGKGGKEIHWRMGDKFEDGKVNDLRLFYDNDNIAVYLYRTIQANNECNLGVSLGSDDTITVWLNHEKVLAKNVTRSCAPDQEFLTLPLQAGENRLLIKICQGNGPAGFYFARGRAKVISTALMKRLVEDFPEDEQEIMVELDWLRQDGITAPDGPYRNAIAKALNKTRVLLADLIVDAAQGFLISEVRQLEALAKESDELASRPSDNVEASDWRSLYLRVRRLKRQTALKNPLLDFGKLLFVKRVPGKYSHMCDQYFGRNARPGGGIFILESLKDRWKVSDVVGAALPEGSFLHPELSYDAKKILFAYRKADAKKREESYYHIWEANVDGSGLRQLTDGRYDDFDPCYLPSDQIVFISTRRGGYGRCHGRPVPLYTLTLMEADGSDIRTISHNEANEWDPSVAADGSILYTRWDYVDRHATNFQSLWAVNPDGSNPLGLYGNNTVNPQGIFQSRQIPGAHKIVATAGPHHSITAGSIIVIDPSRGFDGMTPLERITPDVPFSESEGHPKTTYMTPYPLSEKYFLAAYSFEPLIFEPMPNPPEAHGLYLIDTFGNKELLYRDAKISCIDPIPLAARKRERVIPSRWNHGVEEGKFIVLNIYDSIEKIPLGSVKTIRVIEIIPKSTPIADVPRMGLAGQETGKLVLGAVPVEEDGSAYFKVPARIPLLFQALDDEGMAIHTMRSLTYVQPGETLSCTGCHEPRENVPPPKPVMAVGRRPSAITPGPEGSAPLSFPLLVQPVLNKYCTSCHNEDNKDKPEGKIILTGEPTAQFTRSYETLMNMKGVVERFRAWNKIVNTTPGKFGARASLLIEMLKKGHYDIKLDRDSIVRLATWLDSNALFYGTFDPREQVKQKKGLKIVLDNILK